MILLCATNIGDEAGTVGDEGKWGGFVSGSRGAVAVKQ